jgi:hypothetical protein
MPTYDSNGNPVPDNYGSGYYTPQLRLNDDFSVNGGSSVPSMNMGNYDPLKSLSGGGKDANSWGLGKNMNTLNLGLNGIGQLGSLYLGLQQLGLAKDSFKFQKQAFNKNLANQTSAYNTQVRDRVSGRNYATEEDRKAAEAAALLPG